MKGVMGKQVSCMTSIGVHSTIQLIYGKTWEGQGMRLLIVHGAPQLVSCNYYVCLVVVL